MPAPRAATPGAPGSLGGSAQLLVLGGVHSTNEVSVEELRNSPPLRCDHAAPDAAAADEEDAAAMEVPTAYAKPSEDASTAASFSCTASSVSHAAAAPAAAAPPAMPPAAPTAMAGAAGYTVAPGPARFGGGLGNRLYTPPVVPVGLSMSGLSLSHASPPHALIASRKGGKGGGMHPHGTEAANGAAAGEDGTAAGEGGADGNGGSGEDLDLMYDPMLNCYYDPRTNKYYELA